MFDRLSAGRIVFSPRRRPLGGRTAAINYRRPPNIEWKYSQFYKEFGSDEKPWSLTIWYFGTEAEWVEEYRDDQLYDEATAEVYFYSQTEPPMNEECTAYDGNYWHYASDGVTPVVWVKE